MVGTDPATDVALLKVEASGWPALPLGDSDRLQVAEPVMAIGNPFGLDQTVTTGIVSAKERFIGAGRYDDFIQTDASINPGNSGGPLIDARGAVVGINTAIFSQTGGSVGIGFAIPINLAKTVAGAAPRRAAPWSAAGSAWRSTGSRRPMRRRPGCRMRGGVKIVEVLADSPAERAGLRKGDIIVAVNDQPVSGPSDLTRRIASTPPGTRAPVTIVRDGGRKTIQVELGRLPERAQQPPPPGRARLSRPGGRRPSGRRAAPSRRCGRGGASRRGSSTIAPGPAVSRSGPTRSSASPSTT